MTYFRSHSQETGAGRDLSIGLLKAPGLEGYLDLYLPSSGLVAGVRGAWSNVGKGPFNKGAFVTSLSLFATRLVPGVIKACRD